MNTGESEPNPTSQGSQGTANHPPDSAEGFRCDGRAAQSQDTAGTNLTATDRRGKHGSHGKQGSRRHNKKASSKAKKGPQKEAEHTEKNPPPTFSLIQEWHIVVGDQQARADSRTTQATELARAIKIKYKKKFRGEKQEKWIPKAICELQERVQNEKWKEDENPDDVGLVLVKCKANSMERVQPEQANKYGYEGDKDPTFGVGVEDEALVFFFKSRDAPKLENEIERHMKNLIELRKSETQPQPPLDEMDDFEATLRFFQSKVDRAKNNCPLAKKLLQSLSPIKPLESQWKALVKQSTLKVPPAAAAPANTVFHHPHGSIPINHGTDVDSTREIDTTTQFPIFAYDPHRQDNTTGTQPLHGGSEIPLPKVHGALSNSDPFHRVDMNHQVSDPLMECAGMVGDVDDQETYELVGTRRPSVFENHEAPRSKKARKSEMDRSETSRTYESVTMEEASFDDQDLSMESDPELLQEAMNCTIGTGQSGGDANSQAEERWRSLEVANGLNVAHADDIPIAISPIPQADLGSQPVTPENSPETTHKKRLQAVLQRITVFGIPIFDPSNNGTKRSAPREHDGRRLGRFFGSVRNRLGRAFPRFRRRG